MFSFPRSESPIRIAGGGCYISPEFRASEVLHRMEPETYRIYLAEFDGADADAAAPAEEEA